ncbi:MAG: IS1595 family transposase [Rhodospirillales bacterium]|nr:IS1595 family transposase [Rhodospirillales bacterium]
MTKKAPGRVHRQGMTIIELFKRYPTDHAAEKWFEAQRWPDGRFCPDCGSTNTVRVKGRKPMPYRCRDCRSHFSVRKGTVMQASRIGLQKWLIAIYMMTTGIKGTSSMKLHREIGVRQATAWFMMQRIREGFVDGDAKPFIGPVEVDESHFGGKRKNMHAKRRRELREKHGKARWGAHTVVAGAKDRETGRVRGRVVPGVDRQTLYGFVDEVAAPDATLYTDEWKSYRGARADHVAVNHSTGTFVKDMAHTNGLESFWSLMKRGYTGTYHKLSPKHLDRYVAEFAGRHNVRDMDTPVQMGTLVRGMEGRRLRYVDLIADNGLDSGARS